MSRTEDPGKGNKRREDGGKDVTGSDVNDAWCVACDVWYNSSRDEAANAHAGH